MDGREREAPAEPELWKLGRSLTLPHPHTRTPIRPHSPSAPLSQPSPLPDLGTLGGVGSQRPTTRTRATTRTIGGGRNAPISLTKDGHTAYNSPG